MKTSQVVFIFCLLISLSCEWTDQQLNSISDLKKINFGQSMPKHTLMLLHWFANTVDIDDNNDVVRLTFNPNRDYGSHHYGNYENMLDPLPRSYRYYTVGNLNQNTSDELPDYVLNPPMREYEETNMDRIIFRAQEQYSGVHRVDRVYITQHDSPWTRYDPEHTYQITTNLLREIRMFSIGNQRTLSELRDQFQSSADESDIINTWGCNLACVGLLLYIVIQDTKNRFSYKQQKPENRTQPEETEDTPPEALHLNPLEHKAREELDLVHNTRDQPEQDGSVVPFVNDQHTDQNVSSALALTEDNRTQAEEAEDTPPHFESNTSNDWEETHPLNPLEHKAWEETHPLNPLEHKAREELDLVRKNHNTRDQPEQDGSVVPFVNNQHTDQNVSSTLTSTQDNRVASADDNLVPLNDSLHNWGLWCLSIFVILLVNFIHPGQHPGGVTITGYNAKLELFVRKDKTCARLYVNSYFTDWRSKFYWSWVGFYRSAEKDTHQYEWGQWQWAVQFEPCSESVNIKYSCLEYCSEMVAAPGVQVRFILTQNLEIARSQQPEGVELTGYNAHLQLFVRNGKACARLYVKKSFRQWRSEFEESWVGLYKSAERDTHDYETWQWQWATKFKECPDCDKYRENDIFDYCSDTTYTRGVQVRFIHRDSTELARHPKWYWLDDV